jgi:hypothetical protein
MRPCHCHFISPPHSSSSYKSSFQKDERTKHGSLKKRRCFSVNRRGGIHWARKYFHFFPCLSRYCCPSMVVAMTTIVSACYKTLAASSSSWNLDLESTQAPCRERLTRVESRSKQRALQQLLGSSQRGAVRLGGGALV